MYFIIKLLCNSHKYLCVKGKTRKQIFKGHVTYMPILITFFSFCFKTTLFCCLLFIFFLFLHFDFSIYFYILVLSKYLGNINWEVLLLAKFGKLRTAGFLTLANTLTGFSAKSMKSGTAREFFLVSGKYGNRKFVCYHWKIREFF